MSSSFHPSASSSIPSSSSSIPSSLSIYLSPSSSIPSLRRCRFSPPRHHSSHPPLIIPPHLSPPPVPSSNEHEPAHIPLEGEGWVWLRSELMCLLVALVIGPTSLRRGERPIATSYRVVESPLGWRGRRWWWQDERR